jgi:hypothetical protein
LHSDAEGESHAMQERTPEKGRRGQSHLTGSPKGSAGGGMTSRNQAG